MEQEAKLSFALPKPRAAMITMLSAIAAIWAGLAINTKWGAGPGVFNALVGRPEALFGEPWRIFTNPFVHDVHSLGHIATRLLTLYFLGASLEERWTKTRFVVFFLTTAWISSFVELLVQRFIPWFRVGDAVFGSMGLANAAVVAYAISLRGMSAKLFGALAINTTSLLLFTLVMNVIYCVSGGGPEGFTTPFVSLAIGAALSDGSPLRKAYLRFRYKQLAGAKARLASGRDEEVVSMLRERTAARPKLRVIEGGASSKGAKRPDKSMLN